MTLLKFIIPGKPIAKARPKFFSKETKSGKKFTGSYNTQTTEEGKFIIQMIEQLPSGFQQFERGVAILIDCEFHMPIPKTSKKKHAQMLSNEIGHTKKPDTDNMIKFLKDCCNGIVWHDDSQVTVIVATKRYSDNPATHFLVCEDMP